MSKINYETDDISFLYYLTMTKTVAHMMAAANIDPPTDVYKTSTCCRSMYETAEAVE